MIKRSLTIATAGHVDHGKTSLVRHITGTNTDTLEEEKTRGLTINLGYAYYHFQCETDGERSEEHTSELQSRRISYAVFCLKKKTTYYIINIFAQF